MIIALLIWTVTTLSTRSTQDYVEYSQVVSWFQDEQVTAFSVSESNVLTMQLRDGSVYRHALADLDLFHGDLGALILEQQQSGILTQFDYQQGYQMPLWLQITLPVVLSLAAVFLLWWIMAVRQQNAQNGGGGGQGGMSRFGKARTVSGGEGEHKVTFADVAGADEEKAELQELVDFLREPQKFIDLGARIPKGVLLVGPPGTGKTLLARAVAGEAGVKFLSISGSDFVELYVGVGASRVRDLFDQAKKESPAIVFIDEIDAVGRQRGAGLGGGHDEREQTLNQLLVEMDGFAANEGVIVLAATNRQDILDPALLRPGRFDRQVYVGRPDMKGREEILRVHTRNKPLSEDVDLKEIARETTGFTGAVSDLQRCTEIARDMVTKYGMSEKLGNVTFTTGHNEVFIGRDMAQAKPYSEETAALIDEEVKALIDGAFVKSREILARDRDKLELVAQYLLKNETMTAEQFQLVYDDPAKLAAQL